jgi:acyl-CoA dehydrogenase
VPYIDTYATEEIKKKYLPGCVSGDIITAVAMTEPGAGSDLSAITATAVEDGDSIIIDGSKSFISNGQNADLIVVAARDPHVENPHQSLSLYLVEGSTPGFTRGRHLEKMGYHSQDTAELFFSNCRIPAANLLGPKGAGFTILMEKLQQERLVCAVGAVASAEGVLEWTVDFCKKRYVSGRPLSKSQAVQFDIVEMSSELKMTRAFVNDVVMSHMSGMAEPSAAAIAKYRTADLYHEITRRCLDIIGDDAMAESCPVARAFRDSKVMPIFAGTNEIMKKIIARSMGL